MGVSVLVLIDLSSQVSFEFQYFPNIIRSQRGVNWRPQDTTIGTKPLMYENREPKRLSFTELWLDSTDTGDSLTGLLEILEEFCTSESDSAGVSRGRPPVLLATWGDRRQRCVLTDLTVEEEFFNEAGEPTRARLSIELIEVQDNTNVDVIIR